MASSLAACALPCRPLILFSLSISFNSSAKRQRYLEIANLFLNLVCIYVLINQVCVTVTYSCINWATSHNVYCVFSGCKCSKNQRHFSPTARKMLYKPGLSLRAGSRPKRLASYLFPAVYFCLILSLLLTKKLILIKKKLLKLLVMHPFHSFESKSMHILTDRTRIPRSR